MASVFISEELTCAVCLSIFTDPVNLPCGHSFCRQCITSVLSTSQQCPQCGTDVPADPRCLPTSLALKSLAERAKEAERLKKTGDETAEMAELCPEHEEKLKLFCITDQQLACIICRDGEKHEGHRFKPVREAAALLRKELETFVQHAADDISAAQSLADTQKQEIAKSKEKSQQLMTQIGHQFQTMHQFLRRREDEIKNELKHKEEENVAQMTEALTAIETALCESQELEARAASALQISDSERFLKTWTEGTCNMTPEQLFRPRANELQVEKTALCLDPYESHLQFFMWKEMLQVIQPREELLTLRGGSPNVAVSADGRSLFSKPQTDPQGFSRSATTGGLTFGAKASPGLFGSSASLHDSSSFSAGFGQPQKPAYQSGFGTVSFGSPVNLGVSVTYDALSVSEFASGQHYWEIDVRNRNFWEFGIKGHYLRYDRQKYAICGATETTELVLENKPGKIGIYLNCGSRKLSFYDADRMARIHTLSVTVSMPVSAYINIKPMEPDYSPLTVCWY